MKRFLFFIALLLASMSLQAGELVFHWNKINESKIFDMELMPDNVYFVVVTANELQVRKTEDGEIVKTYPKNESFKQHDIEFSTDSTKIFLSYGEVIEIRNAEDFSIIKTYTMPPAEEGYSQRFLEIKVDPKKPYIYALERQWWVGTPGLGTDRYGICVYNYETMGKVADITPTGFEHKYYENMAISNDGKYLSFINQGESYLVTIDLSTQKVFQTFKICNNYSDGGGHGGWPCCIKFSELNSDKIYFTGNFPQSNTDLEEHCGLFIYSISENKIIDSTFGVENNKILESKFTYFDKENKVIAISSIYLRVINYENKNIEFKRKLDINISISDKILYNKENDYFIGFSSSLIGKIGYKNDTDIVEKIDIVDSVYPNPTTNEIIIKINCKQSFINYKILNINSQVLAEETTNIQDNSLLIDFSTYSSGSYFIQILCDDSIRTYKVIKEN